MFFAVHISLKERYIGEPTHYSIFVLRFVQGMSICSVSVCVLQVCVKKAMFVLNSTLCDESNMFCAKPCLVCIEEESNVFPCVDISVLLLVRTANPDHCKQRSINSSHPTYLIAFFLLYLSHIHVH